jgi:SNF2 family DNA or RNA helicase
MNDGVFGNNWYAFKFTYGIWGGFGKYQLRGYRHLKELVTKVRAHAYRITKEQCLDLPPKVYENVPVTLSTRAQAMYVKMAKEMIVEIEETHATAAIVLVKLLRLSQITSGFIKDVEGKIRIFDDSKLNTCLDLLDDLLEEDHKVVVFSRFISDMRRLEEKLIARKVKPLILDGSVPGRQRDSLIAKFQSDPNAKVFIAQIQTGSEGIELFAADAVIYYSLGTNALHYWQSQDRVHRPGQKKKVTYYHLIVPRTIDQVELQSMQAKKSVADAILKNPLSLLG